MNASDCVMDHDVVRLSADWKTDCMKQTPASVAFHTVDSTSIVPTSVSSDRAEPSVTAFRGKHEAKLKQYLVPFPAIEKHPYTLPAEYASTAKEWLAEFTVDDLLKNWYKNLDSKVLPCSWLHAGDDGARKSLDQFINEGLAGYAHSRGNNHVKDIMSAYLMFGHISTHAIALAVEPLRAKYPKDVDAFLTDVVVALEYGMNQLQYNKEVVADAESGLYPKFDAAAWSNATVQQPGKGVYTREQMDAFKTHDTVWNAIHKELVDTGKMCDSFCGYWARKILDWSVSPEAGFNNALFFKDRYTVGYRNAWAYVELHLTMVGAQESVATVEKRITSEMNKMQADYEKRIAALETQIGATST